MVFLALKRYKLARRSLDWKGRCLMSSLTEIISPTRPRVMSINYLLLLYAVLEFLLFLKIVFLFCFFQVS